MMVCGWNLVYVILGENRGFIKDKNIKYANYDKILFDFSILDVILQTICNKHHNFN